MSDLNLSGVHPAMCTPFEEDGSIDFQGLRENVRRLENAGVSGLVPMGSTGESATASHDEHVDVIRAVSKEADIPVIAGSGSNNTREALSLSRRAKEAGADGLLLISPYYNKPPQRGLKQHYLEIADSIDIPQIVYNVPSRTGRSLESDTVSSLAQHENIIGYKAAGGQMGRISKIIEETRSENFYVLSGNDGETLPIISMGGYGCISVAANVEPELMSEMVRYANNENFGRARELHHKLGPLFRAMFCETNPIPVKAALEERELGNGNLRSPLSEISDENRGRIIKTLERYN